MTMTLLIALLVGLGFGFALDRIAATSPEQILRMLTLRDLHLAKTILLGIGVASTLMFAGQLVGLVDVGHMSVKTSYLGVAIGGALFGVGWAITGYCPGTGVAALGSGRKDAFAFVAGGIAGALLYAVTYPWWKSLGVLGGDKLILGDIAGSGADGVLGLSGQVVGLLMGALLIALAFALPRFPGRRRRDAAPVGVASTAS